VDAFDKPRTLIQMYNVAKRYGARTALVDIRLTVADNEFLFLSGPSGAGKTTLLKLLYLGEPASEGQIVVDGINLARIARRRVPELRRKFGIVFQDYKLIPNRTIYDNIALVVEAVGTPRRMVRKKVRNLLRTVGMDGREKAMPAGLSGGEQQRVAVARAIAGNPKIIVADEPTGSLDAEAADAIMDLLHLYHRRGAAVIIATHDTELIRTTGGRVVLLKAGRMETSTVIPALPR
jgi:cell division transport system ATP-binding protein